jgi:hypothetical protein
MFPIYLTWALRDIVEVAVTTALITVVMGIFAAVPFIVERYLDDRRKL